MFRCDARTRVPSAPGAPKLLCFLSLLACAQDGEVSIVDPEVQLCDSTRDAEDCNSAATAVGTLAVCDPVEFRAEITKGLVVRALWAIDGTTVVDDENLSDMPNGCTTPPPESPTCEAMACVSDGNNNLYLKCGVNVLFGDAPHTIRIDVENDSEDGTEQKASDSLTVGFDVNTPHMVELTQDAGAGDDFDLSSDVEVGLRVTDPDKGGAGLGGMQLVVTIDGGAPLAEGVAFDPITGDGAIEFRADAVGVGHHELRVCATDGCQESQCDSWEFDVLECAKTNWYVDGDADGHGAFDSPAVESCGAPAGPAYSPTNSDCNDDVFSINPDAMEVCNGIDDNCDDAIDEDGAAPSTWFADSDGDTFGDSLVPTESCEAPFGFVDDATDCNDDVFDINPNAIEVCNGFDDNCDDAIDEDGAAPVTWFADSDGDTFGDALVPTESCEAPFGFVDDATDCNDDVFDINPNTIEVCNGFDDNCDDAIDEDGAAPLTWFADSDGDTFGDSLVPTESCEAPFGFVDDATDCNDDVFDINPNAIEVCNGIDDNCDDAIDEDGAAPLTWFADSDGDTFGDALVPTESCEAPFGFVDDATDCNDDLFDINPDATEVCNGLDDNCDDAIDDKDEDADLHVDEACASSYIGPGVADDCDDTRADVFPGAVEALGDLVGHECDEIVECTDLDCDGLTDLVFTLEGSEGAWELDSIVYDTFGSLVGGLPTMGAQASAVSDLDRNGFLDVVVANSIDNLFQNDIHSFVYWGDAAGHSSLNRLGLPTSTAHDVLIADLDTNGWLDVVFANVENDDTAQEIDSFVYLNLGTPPWFSEDRRLSLPTWGARGVAAGDLDDDGWPDLVFANGQSATRIYWGSGEGYSSAAFLDLSTAYGNTVGVADVDGDGTIDVLVSTLPTLGTSTIHLNTGGRTFDISIQVMTTPIEEQVMADLDGDGMLDFAFVRTGEPEALIYWGADIDWEDRAVGPPTTLSLTTLGTGIAASDVDADGDVDLAVAGAEFGSLWRNDGGGVFTQSGIYNTPSGTDVAIASADILMAMGVGGATDDDGDGLAEADGDCDDSRPEVHPGALEQCNGRDDDCTGAEDAVGAAESINGTDEDCDGVVDSLVQLSVNADIRFLAAASIASPSSAVAFVGDVDGDGIDDTVIASTHDQTAGHDGGAARLTLGGTVGDVDLATSEASILGLGDDDLFGSAVAGLGDPNGDGYNDFAIGSLGAFGTDVYLYTGPLAGALVASDANARVDLDKTVELGVAVAGGGDLTGDGVADALLGAPGNDGGAFVVSGDSTGEVNPWGSFDLKGNGAERAGEAVAAGDVDGDGVVDALVGAPSHGFPNEVGAVYQVHGPVPSLGLDLEWDHDGLVVGVYPGSRAGAAVDLADDFDGDGLADVVIGAPGADGQRGAAYVILSSVPFSGTFTEAASLVVLGSSTSDPAVLPQMQLGFSVAGAEDLDLDGFADVAVGAPGLGGSAGEVLIFLGGTTGWQARDDAAVTFAGDDGTRAGLDLDGGGDWNGDTISDLLIGGSSLNAGEPTAWVVLGGW